MRALLTVSVVAARDAAALVLDVAAVREALAIARTRERAERDAGVDGGLIFARVFVVVVRQRAAIATTTCLALEGRRRRRPLRATRCERYGESENDYCVFGMHVASAPAAAKHVDPWMQSVSVWQG